MSLIGLSACKSVTPKIQPKKELMAADLLGNPNYQAISYGGYRLISREVQPTYEEQREDMLLLSAMGIKVLRTYNVHLPEAANLLATIKRMKAENPAFEMYVMLGIWIDCKDAWTPHPNHDEESEQNAIEVNKAVELANAYPDIVKILAVGNEAMVKWAASYYVQPRVILKWVNHLQDLKKRGVISKDLWITSSDNFASWGGGGSEYHVPDLDKLLEAVDYVSIHTYPMHDTHYTPTFWGIEPSEADLSDLEKIEAAMVRAKNYAISQYDSVVRFMKSKNINKPVHVGETGWASRSNELYGDRGTRATDEYKSALFYRHMREWTNQNGISCFYFEAFDEQWKDATNPDGSENHFGLINLRGQAKYALWDLVDKGVFKGLTRDGSPITKTYNGDLISLLKEVKVPLEIESD